MNNTLLRFLKTLEYVIALVAAVLIIIASLSLPASVFFSDKTVMQTYFTQSQVTSTLLNRLDDELANAAEECDIPSEVFTDAVDTQLSESAQSVVVLYIRSGTQCNFRKLTDVEDTFYEAVSNYCSENKIKASDSEIEEIADTAVETFISVYSANCNTVFAGFISRISSYGYLISGGCIALALVLLVLVSLIEHFRHNSMNYIAMTFLSAGAVNIVAGVLTLTDGIIDRLDFTGSQAYNLAVAEMLNKSATAFTASGFLLVAVGIFFALRAYSYYKNKFSFYEIDTEIEKNLI
ncbi:MAG: hypothetical protein LIO62_03705 [Clostridiales bacterium]|nr:hypothetical protein [Clostridiales bacterium]